MNDDKYTIIGPIQLNGPYLWSGECFVYWSNGVCCKLVGPYCDWPKKEPRRFIIEGGRRRGKTLRMKLAKQLYETFKAKT